MSVSDKDVRSHAKDVRSHAKRLVGQMQAASNHLSLQARQVKGSADLAEKAFDAQVDGVIATIEEYRQKHCLP